MLSVQQGIDHIHIVANPSTLSIKKCGRDSIYLFDFSSKEYPEDAL